ncbi:hypothetical protein DPMN_097006 [Dreissena polymorpha]|uniref:Uncharacterized protein n=1 Tax=Dreissena polymorpha TaxID=45954 RepID=A0A9D4LAZ1_DREPO|nr:hypothetical protein DPMN_097006 [Dreissena polymorpha]
MQVDIDNKLVFPSIVHTNLRSDIVLWSEAVKRLIIIKLTVPWETLGNRMRGGQREEKVQVYRTSRSLQPKMLAYLVVPLRSSR